MHYCMYSETLSGVGIRLFEFAVAGDAKRIGRTEMKKESEIKWILSSMVSLVYSLSMVLDLERLQCIMLFGAET
jgi:hypothetical protein